MPESRVRVIHEESTTYAHHKNCSSHENFESATSKKLSLLLFMHHYYFLIFDAPGKFCTIRCWGFIFVDIKDFFEPAAE